MSAIIHGAGAATALSTFNSNKLVAASRTNLPARYIVSGSNASKSLTVRKLIANAVATKEANTSATTGHELLLFEALQEGLEEEMDKDPHVCVMGEEFVSSGLVLSAFVCCPLLLS